MTTTTLSRREGLRAPSRASTIFLACGAAAIGVYFFLPSDAQSIAYIEIGLASVIAMFAGALLRPVESRLPWYLFALGFLCQVAGDAVFTVYELGFGTEPPLPSTADVLYLAGYPLIVVGIVLLLRQLGGHTSRVALLDTAIVAVAVGTVQWVFLVGSYLDESLPLETRLVHMAYPTMDVLLLIALVQLTLGPARRSTVYWLLIASVGLWVAADEIYGLTANTYSGGAWLDALWLGSYVLWAAAALDTSSAGTSLRDRRAVPRLTSAGVIVLGAALVAVPVLTVADRAQHRAGDVWVEAIGASLIAILVLVRLTRVLKALEASRAAEHSARRAAEEMQLQLAEQNARLVELDRLKDEFVSSVSHELRTPLTAVTGYVELLLDDDHDDETHRYLEIVERNARRLLELVDDLLFAARLEVGGLVELQRRPIDLGVLAEHAIDAAAPDAESAHVDLRLSSDSGPPLVDGDAARLERLLANLVSNAIKFTPADGRVEVRLERHGDTVTVEVSDTGMGIAEEERDRLFERFFRSQAALEHRVPGTGLGLYISKAIVDAHGGRIAVRSVVNEGTTVVVELPASTVPVDDLLLRDQPGLR